MDYGNWTTHLARGRVTLVTIELITPGKKYSVLTTPLSIAFVMIPIYQHLSTLKLYR